MPVARWHFARAQAWAR